MSTSASGSASVSFDDLMMRGYFADRIIPPVNSLSLSPAIRDIWAYATSKMTQIISKQRGVVARSRCVTHSVPKRKHLRRSLAIPNPLHRSMLAAEISTYWQDIRSFCGRSPISHSVPMLGTARAIQATNDLSTQPLHRAQQSVGARYLLKTDIARYYPSIYTHSIPWALHDKQSARADKAFALLGNRIDLWVRETQDKQTGGIPIGPDTSFVIGEVIGTALDLKLQSKIPHLRGTRHVDDYFLYFSTISDAEKWLAALHEVAREFELEINDPKTEIVSLPERLEPPWKSELRNLAIRDSGQPQITDLVTLFDSAFELAQNFPSDSVLTYVAKQTQSATIAEENWRFCEALLLKAAIGEPSMLSVLADIYDKFSGFHTDNSQLGTAIESICAYHAPLQQGNEVAWALWLAKKMSIRITRVVGEKICNMDDDIVALIALDLYHNGLLDAPQFGNWEAYMSAGSLWDNHWLLAYEALEQGWLPPVDGTDYVGNNDFFTILRTHGVRFYGAGTVPTSSYFRY